MDNHNIFMIILASTVDRSHWKVALIRAELHNCYAMKYGCFQLYGEKFGLANTVEIIN